MKRLAKSQQGVTLLEIMLVLAIAAMIIVMSIRYYQSTVTSQQTNTLLQEVTAIVAAANQISAGSGTFATVNTSNVSAALPGGTSGLGGFGGAIAVTGSSTSISVTISSIPEGPCRAVAGQIPNLPPAGAYSGAACTGSGAASSLSFTYTLVY